MFSRAKLTAKPLHCFRATQASVCNLPTKQACAFEDNTESQLTRAPTTTVRQLPTTTRVCRHNETATKRARQLFRLQTEKDTALPCSRIHYARDADECGFHRVPGRSNGGGSWQQDEKA